MPPSLLPSERLKSTMMALPRSFAWPIAEMQHGSGGLVESVAHNPQTSKTKKQKQRQTPPCRARTRIFRSRTAGGCSDNVPPKCVARLFVAPARQACCDPPEEVYDDNK